MKNGSKRELELYVTNSKVDANCRKRKQTSPLINFHFVCRITSIRSNLLSFLKLSMLAILLMQTNGFPHLNWADLSSLKKIGPGS